MTKEGGCGSCLKILNGDERGEIKQCECGTIIAVGREISNPVPDDLSHTRKMNIRELTVNGAVVYDSRWRGE